MSLFFHEAFAQTVSEKASEATETPFFQSVEFFVDAAISLLFVIVFIYGMRIVKRLIDEKIDLIRQAFADAENLQEEERKKLREVNHQAQTLEEEISLLQRQHKQKEQELNERLSSEQVAMRKKLQDDFEQRKEEIKNSSHQKLSQLAVRLLIKATYESLRRSLSESQKRDFLQTALENLPDKEHFLAKKN